jgi:hypothetical protein
LTFSTRAPPLVDFTHCSRHGETSWLELAPKRSSLSTAAKSQVPARRGLSPGVAKSRIPPMNIDANEEVGLRRRKSCFTGKRGAECVFLAREGKNPIQTTAPTRAVGPTSCFHTVCLSFDRFDSPVSDGRLTIGSFRAWQGNSSPLYVSILGTPLNIGNWRAINFTWKENTMKTLAYTVLVLGLVLTSNSFVMAKQSDTNQVPATVHGMRRDHISPCKRMNLPGRPKCRDARSHR